MKIIMLNAPPRAGKDTMAEWFTSNGWKHLKFAKVLKERTHALYGFPDLPYDYFEDRKDENLAEFKGITPRQAYINLSEMLMKPVHGDSIWADFLADQIDGGEGTDRMVISDVGFQVEWETFVQRFGVETLALVTVHRDGCTYEGDSREYVDTSRFDYIKSVKDPDLYSKYVSENSFDVFNNSSLDTLYATCGEIEKKVDPEVKGSIFHARVGNL